jgi:hypothetical protein
MLGDFERAIESEQDDSRFMAAYALAAMGRVEEATEIYERTRGKVTTPLGLAVYDAQHFAHVGQREACVRSLRLISSFRDPEGLYFTARTFAYVHETEEALQLLRGVVEGGYYQPARMTRDPWLDSVRAEPEFIRLLRLAEARRRDAVAAYLEHGGDKILGVSPSG